MNDLARRAADPGRMGATLRTAFGARAAGGAGAALLARLAAGPDPGSGAGPGIGPTIRVVDDAVLPPATRGAYVPTGTTSGTASGAGAGAVGGVILVHRDLLSDSGTLRAVVAEELGHHLDAQLGAGDAAGDEGAIFARALAGETLAPDALARLRAEDDHGRLADGRRVEFYEPEGATSGDGGGSSSAPSSASSSGPGPGEGTMDAAASQSQSSASSSSSSSSSEPGPGPEEGSLDAAASQWQSGGHPASTVGSSDAPDRSDGSTPSSDGPDRHSDDDGDDGDEHGWSGRTGSSGSGGGPGSPSGVGPAPPGDDGGRTDAPSAGPSAVGGSLDRAALASGAVLATRGALLDAWRGTGIGGETPEAEAARAEAALEAELAAMGRVEAERFERQARAMEFPAPAAATALQAAATLPGAQVPGAPATIGAATLEALGGRFGPGQAPSPGTALGDGVASGLPRLGGRLASGVLGGIVSPSPAGGGRVEIPIGPDLRAVGPGADLQRQIERRVDGAWVPTGVGAVPGMDGALEFDAAALRRALGGALPEALEEALSAEGMDAAAPLPDLPGFLPDPPMPEAPEGMDAAPLELAPQGTAPADPLPGVESFPVADPAWPDLVERRARAILLAEQGPPPAGMANPHAHHILSQVGIGPAQQALVREGKRILEDHGIDPLHGPENLTWAPNVAGQHTLGNLEALMEQLRETNASELVIREDIVRVLERHGTYAQDVGRSTR